MKKRVLSALMAVGLACSLVVTAFATADVSATPAPTAAVESQNTETESSDPAAEADPTETPAETPAATQEPTPALEESTPAPSEEPASSATPEPTAEPSAAPDDTVTATPTPTPEATAAPTPEATEEPAAAEPTAEPEATAEPAETETQSAEVEIDGQLVNVFVDIPVGAFEEGVTPVLHAEAVSAEDADKAAETVAEQTGATFDSMMVLDVYFTDGDNTDEIEPALPVSVRFELPEAALPENIDASTLTVHHIAEEKDEAGNKVDYTTEEAVITNSTNVMMTTVAGNEAAIGYSSMGSLNETVKALQVDGVEATVENIKSGDYKVARPFNIATKGEVSESAQDFISYILSAEGQVVVAENGYIPLDDAPAYAGKQVSGKIVVAGSSSVTPVMEKLKEAYAVLNPNAEIEIQQSDSTTGMQSAIDGVCDIGMASRDLKDSELEAGLTGTTIAMDGIAIIVNPANPVDSMTVEEIEQIFTGAVTTWEGFQK